jgi:hypothetical protein
MGLGPSGPSRTHAAASTAFEAALEGHGRSQQMGAARRTIFCRNVCQNAARIDHTARKVLISRDFVRAVLSTVYQPLGTLTARVSTVKDLLSLQVFYPLRDPRGRYVNDLCGYIGRVQVNEGCCQLISRR